MSQQLQQPQQLQQYSASQPQPTTTTTTTTSAEEEVRTLQQQQDVDSTDLTIAAAAAAAAAASSDIVTTDNYNILQQQETTTFEEVDEYLGRSLAYHAPPILEGCSSLRLHGSKSTTSTWVDFSKARSPSLIDGRADEAINLICRDLREIEHRRRTCRNLFVCEYKIKSKIVVRPPHPPIERSQTVDDAERVRQIGALIKMGDRQLDKIDVEYLDLLDELIELAGSVDIAKELHSIEGLDDLINCMGINQTGLPGKTGEVISAMADKYPNSRLLVLEVGLSGCLMDYYIGNPNGTSMAKILHALFSLFRNNKDGIALFLESKRFKRVWSIGLISMCVDFQRRLLNLIHCLLHENNSECNIVVCDMVTKFGFHSKMMHLARSDYADVQEAALRCLLVLTRVEEGEHSDLKHFLQDLMEGISAMAPEDLGDDALWEIRLVDSLWSACYNKPSPLREKGLFMLPNEDLSPSDLAIKLFEPPLETWANAGKNNCEKKKAPLLFGIGPPSATPPV